MGVGSTGVAALNLGRKFIGIEIDENYFRAAERRIREAAAKLKLFKQ
jgi:DNA modification methylase